jgi:hypothetical protein
LPLAISASESSYFQICAAVRWLCEADRRPFLKAIVDARVTRLATASLRVPLGAPSRHSTGRRRTTQGCGRLSCCARSAIDGRSNVVLGRSTAREPPRTQQLHFLGLSGFTTYCPRIRGKQGERSTRLFLGYAFVWIELQWHAARWAPGVVRLDCLMQMCGRPDQQIAVCKTSEQHAGLAVSGRLKRAANRGQHHGYILGRSKFSCDLNDDSRRVSGHRPSSALCQKRISLRREKITGTRRRL